MSLKNAGYSAAIVGLPRDDFPAFAPRAFQPQIYGCTFIKHESLDLIRLRAKKHMDSVLVVYLSGIFPAAFPTVFLANRTSRHCFCWCRQERSRSKQEP